MFHTSWEAGYVLLLRLGLVNMLKPLAVGEIFDTRTVAIPNLGKRFALFVLFIDGGGFRNRFASET